MPFPEQSPGTQLTHCSAEPPDVVDNGKKPRATSHWQVVAGPWAVEIWMQNELAGQAACPNRGSPEDGDVAVQVRLQCVP